MIADLLPYKFTKASASLGGIRSGEVRRAKAFFKQTFDKPPSPDTVRAALNAQLSLVNEQITLTRDVLNDKAVEPHHRAQLLKALDSLLDRQRILLNVPSPGTLKPERKAKAIQVWSEPEPVATPQQIDNSGRYDPSI